MSERKCNFCGSLRYENRTTDYMHSYKGNYLLVPETPIEVCSNCRMVYYDATVLKRIEKRFFAIQRKEEAADSYIEIPTARYA